MKKALKHLLTIISALLVILIYNIATYQVFSV